MVAIARARSRGGTPGTLRRGAIPLASILIHVHQRDGSTYREIGTGVLGSDGRFQLVTRDATGPLVLEPGECRFTLESVGPVVLKWPAEFHDPATTPLGYDWESMDDTLELDVPEPSQ